MATERVVIFCAAWVSGYLVGSFVTWLGCRRQYNRYWLKGVKDRPLIDAAQEPGAQRTALRRYREGVPR